MKPILAFLLCLPVIGAFAQDSTWKNVSISGDVTVLLPGHPTKQEFTENGQSALICYSKYGGQVFMVEYSRQSAEFANRDSLNNFYDLFIVGLKRSAMFKGRTCIVSDTILCQTSGKVIRTSPGETPVFMYLTVANGTCYAISVIKTPAAAGTAAEDFQTFLDGVVFTKPIREESLR